MKVKSVVLALATTGLISSHAFAAEVDVKAPASPQTQAAFTEADTSTLFEVSGKPMQVAALSSAEMKETEGAYLANAAGAALGLAGYGAFCTIGTGSCSALGAITAAGMGAMSPVRGATHAIAAARGVWQFNANVGSGIVGGVGSHYGM